MSALRYLALMSRVKRMCPAAQAPSLEGRIENRSAQIQQASSIGSVRLRRKPLSIPVASIACAPGACGTWLLPRPSVLASRSMSLFIAACLRSRSGARQPGSGAGRLRTVSINGQVAFGKGTARLTRRLCCLRLRAEKPHAQSSYLWVRLLTNRSSGR